MTDEDDRVVETERSTFNERPGDVREQRAHETDVTRVEALVNDTEELLANQSHSPSGYSDASDPLSRRLSSAAAAPPPVPLSTHAIEIESLLETGDLALAHAFEAEKTYSVPLDIPDFGWRDCFQLGLRLTYTTMLLRRNLSPRELCLDEAATTGARAVGRLSATQIAVFAHAGLAFNSSMQSLVIRQTSPPPLAKPPDKKSTKRRPRKPKQRGSPRSKLPGGKRLATIGLDDRHPDKLGDRGAIALFRALRVNRSLLSLSLQHVGLGDDAACALAATLRCNSTLTQLTLEGNRIGPLGTRALCDALEDSPDSMLLRLDLSRNRITDAGVPFLCRALRENETLVSLDVSWNQLTSPALLELLAALRDNFVLSDVAAHGRDCDEDQFCQNHESKYAQRLADALRRVNASFDELRLTSARARLPVRKLKHSRWVALPGADLMEVDALVIAGLLPLNAKLLTLDLSNNPGIERWAVLELLASIQRCPTLRHVNLANTGLHAEAAELVAELVASNDTLASITMHTAAIDVQQARGCRADAAVETLALAVPAQHHFDRWILAKCLALNRPTKELNGIRLPGATAAAGATRRGARLVSVNLSGRALELFEAVFLSKKVFHHLHLSRLALNSCSVDSVGGAALADAVRNHATLEALELEHNALGAAGGAAMAECVQANASLTYLNLSWNGIGDDGATGLRDALRANRTLRRLDLRGNVLGAAAVVAISEGLRGNASLEELFLRWNVICPRGAEALALALTANKTLRVLDIEHHAMGERGARAFARMLAANRTLQALNMKGDDAVADGDARGIGAEPAQAIAAALAQANTSLTSLNIAQNLIGSDGVAAFSRLLQRTGTLAVLDLSRSGMDGKVARRFFECVGMNATLKTLSVAHNRIGNEGMAACVKALEANKVLADLNVADNGVTEEPLALLLHRLRSPAAALALRWLCIADNAMTDRTYEAFRTLHVAGLTVVLEEEKHRTPIIMGP
ncbi:hypothetical protein PybrP1_005989 [[Pythium] brassicae (nom. inval.)]|nr:hypothetical protein PybrP1_005989 [[Pythium] brassicae (nom. inval.)]